VIVLVLNNLNFKLKGIIMTWAAIGGVVVVFIIIFIAISSSKKKK
jgi:hypothetical protein